MMKKLISRFRKETWTKVKEEPASVDVFRYGSFWKKVEATLAFEESSRGNKRYVMTEHTGVMARRPYLIDFETKEPLPGQGFTH